MEENLSQVISCSLGRHVVCLGWTDNTPGDRAAANKGYGYFENASGFIISVRKHWFFVTAGHVIEEIEEARKNGQVLNGWHLDDTGGSGAASPFPMPFDYTNAWKFWLNDKDQSKAD